MRFDINVEPQRPVPTMKTGGDLIMDMLFILQSCMFGFLIAGSRTERKAFHMVVTFWAWTNITVSVIQSSGYDSHAKGPQE